MAHPPSQGWFFGVLALAAAFVLLSGASLPPVVASHFVAGGAANGFMPRSAYLTLMLGLVVVLPLLFMLMHGLVRFIPLRFINLPNREYWLAPERCDETLAFLQRQGAYFSVVLAAFLCFVHWLVVRAHGVQPPVLPEAPFKAGLVLFLVALVVWMGAFIARFRRP